MMEMREFLPYFWKIPAGMGGFTLGLLIGGMVLPILGLNIPVIPEGVDTATVGIIAMTMSVLVIISSALIAKDLEGTFWSRWVSIGMLIFVAYGVNNALEGALFSTIEALATPENMISTIVLQAFPSFMSGAVIAGTVKPKERGQPFQENIQIFLASWGVNMLLLRLVISWVAFVIIYAGIGMLIAPFVMPIYTAGEFNLILPSFDQILILQFIRGAFILVICLLLIIAWQGSNLRFFVSLGVALSILLGLFPLTLSYWIAIEVRAIHIIEIAVDSFLYAGVLTKLFLRPPTLSEK
ncbi:MAG: hypothetical protein ACFFCZ_17295 [Promethearchaeota archaeon]